MVNKSESSDSFARHFSQHLFSVRNQKENKKVTLNDVQKIVRVKTLWQGRAISCMKTFGKVSCRLCMQERLEIHKAILTEKKNGSFNLINSAHELYGACRHKTQFHRFESLQPPSADKERTGSENSMTSSDSTKGENDSTTNLDYSRKVQYCMPISVGK